MAKRFVNILTWDLLMWEWKVFVTFEFSIQNVTNISNSTLSGRIFKSVNFPNSKMAAFNFSIAIFWKRLHNVSSLFSTITAASQLYGETFFGNFYPSYRLIIFLPRVLIIRMENREFFTKNIFRNFQTFLLKIFLCETSTSAQKWWQQKCLFGYFIKLREENFKKTVWLYI